MADKSLMKKLSWMVTELHKITKSVEKEWKRKEKKEEMFFLGEMDIKKILTSPIWREEVIKAETSYSIENIRLLYTLASHALIALENILLYEKTRKMTISDELTSTYNYRYFQIRLREEINRASRYKFPLALMMIDLDNFKKYNDTCGHLKGDEILKRVADIINKNIRLIDILCRYGGDEFAVILPNTEVVSTSVLSVAERVRKKVEEAGFEFGKGKKKFKISLSVGVAFYPREAKDVKELVNLADKAMYEAKKAGGNKSVIYQSRIKTKRKAKI